MYRIVNKHGYVEVRDEFDRFVLSADSKWEAEREIDNLEREFDID